MNSSKYLILALLHPLLPSPLAAQSSLDVPVELQEADLYGMGARAMAMGGAFTGVADDVSALCFNPAGLAQIEVPEISIGVVNDRFNRTTGRNELTFRNENITRLGHATLAVPVDLYGGRRFVPGHRKNFVVAFGFHRHANLNAQFFKEGILLLPTSAEDGLYDLEEFAREGSVNRWTAGFGLDVSPHVAVGGTVSFLSGSSLETVTLANYPLVEDGDDLLVVPPEDWAVGEDRAYLYETYRDATLTGITGSVGLLVTGGPFRFGGSLDFPTGLDWEGETAFRLEDWEKIDGNFQNPDTYPVYYRDDITLPLNLRGGASFTVLGLLLSGGVRWTDYTQIDFEGPILAPGSGRQSAYRSVVAYHAGAEFRFPRLPFRVQAGVYTEPLPYRLIAADTDFRFMADDTTRTDDVSQVFRDYPTADVVTDKIFYTAGAGLTIDDTLSLEAAVVYEEWKRQTPAGYENTTEFYPTVGTLEEVEEIRALVTGTVYFR